MGCLVHNDYVNHTFVDDDKQHSKFKSKKSPLPIDKMNEINAKVEEFDFTYINYPKIN